MTNLEVQKRDLEQILANKPEKCSPAREAEYKRFREILDAINRKLDPKPSDELPAVDAFDWG